MAPRRPGRRADAQLPLEHRPPLGACSTRRPGSAASTRPRACSTAGLLTVHNAVLRKRGDQLTGDRGRDRSRPAGVAPGARLGSAGRVRRTAQLTLRGPRRCSASRAAVDATVQTAERRAGRVPRRPVRRARHDHAVLEPGGRRRGSLGGPAPGGFTVTAQALTGSDRALAERRTAAPQSASVSTLLSTFSYRCDRALASPGDGGDGGA